MALKKILWHEVETYFTNKGYSIYPQGDDIVIAEPKIQGGKMRNAVRIGHECCHTRSAEVTRPYLRQLKEVFGVSF